MMRRFVQTWMLALGGWGVLMTAPEAAKAEEKTPSPEQAQNSDLLFLRDFLSNAFKENKRPLPELLNDASKALDRLALKDAGRGHAYKTLKAFLKAAVRQAAERISSVNTQFAMHRTKCWSPEYQPANWLRHARYLMDQTKSKCPSEAVYQETRGALVEELRKEVAGTEVDGAKPFPRTVEETVQLVLMLLGPELKFPEAQPFPLREEIAGLIDRFRDPDFKMREAAAERMREIGVPALGALREVLKDKDPEIAERARTVRSRILSDHGLHFLD